MLVFAAAPHQHADAGGRLRFLVDPEGQDGAERGQPDGIRAGSSAHIGVRRQGKTEIGAPALARPDGAEESAGRSSPPRAGGLPPSTRSKWRRASVSSPLRKKARARSSRARTKPGRITSMRRRAAMAASRKAVRALASMPLGDPGLPAAAMPARPTRNSRRRSLGRAFTADRRAFSAATGRPARSSTVARAAAVVVAAFVCATTGEAAGSGPAKQSSTAAATMARRRNPGRSAVMPLCRRRKPVPVISTGAGRRAAERRYLSGTARWSEAPRGKDFSARFVRSK